MSKINDVREYVRRSLEENIKLNNWISTQEKVNDDHIGDICKDFLQVLEAFEWAEETIHERGLDQSKISTSAITRMLTAKSKLLEVLESYGVKKVTFPDGKMNSVMAVVVDTVANPEKVDNTVVSVLKDGFYRKNRVLRQAEVIVVNNHSDESTEPMEVEEPIETFDTIDPTESTEAPSQVEIIPLEDESEDAPIIIPRT